MKRFFKTFKEEFIVIPVLAVAIYGYHLFMFSYFPESAQFDLISEIENIIWAIVKLVVYTSLSWVALRVVFPGFYRYLIEDYRSNFDSLSNDKKRVYSISLWFAFLLILALLA